MAYDHFIDFRVAYELQGSLQSDFTLQDIPSTKTLVDPVAGTVKVVDPNGGTVSLGKQSRRHPKD